MSRHWMRQDLWYDAMLRHKDRLLDHEWLTQFLQPYAHIVRLRWRGRRPRISQFPTEFASFLILMAEKQCDSYIEIGTSTGGSFFVADTYLRLTVPGYKGAVGVDRNFKLRNWDLYKARFPETEFWHTNSRGLNLGDRQFGAAFIDARHLERWVLADFEKVKRNARLVGFHDIVLVGATVGPAWEAIKAKHTRNWEFIDTNYPPETRCGIGVVQTRD